MLTALPFLLASVVVLAGGDTVKKKSPLAPVPAAKGSKGVSAAGRAQSTQQAAIALAGGRATTPARATAPVPATKAPAPKPALLGSAIGKSLASAARAVAPRTSFISSAIRRRASRGPALPPHIRGNPNAVEVYADSIVVEKSRHTMTLYNQGTPVRIYFIALGQNPLGDKIGRGDNRTPEGLYYIEGHNPGSKYHLSLKVSYPNAQDVAEAGARGLAAGGDIMIHGLPKGFEKMGAEHRQRDWTNGCIAVTNAEIEEIWTAIPDGAAIHIKP